MRKVPRLKESVDKDSLVLVMHMNRDPISLVLEPRLPIIVSRLARGHEVDFWEGGDMSQTTISIGCVVIMVIDVVVLVFNVITLSISIQWWWLLRK
jgi:uncharacterized membrane protein YdbT with pleckstrin-like domain